MPREQLRMVQLERLRWTVDRLIRHVAPMRSRFLAAGIANARDITSLDDLARLPFSTKADLREHYPFGLFAAPRSEVVRVHASSGTRGKPTVVGYTRNDLEVWAEVVARTLALAGVRPGMVFHNATGYGLFTGGLGFHMGAERMGCTVVPVGGGFSQRQVMLLQDLGGQVLKSTPSYALNIAATMEEMGVDPASLALEIGLFGAEPWTAEMRPQLERRLGLAAMNDYGLSEIIGPGVSGECIEARDGLHIHEDHFLPEVIDPVSLAPLPPGREGELVFTTLTKEALPLVRYRTGDLSWLIDGACVCGRTLVRMGPVRGRLDDMLIIRGVNLFPSEVERVLLSVEGMSPHYQIVVDRPSELDELTVLCEPAGFGSDTGALARAAADALHQSTGLHVRVEMLAPGQVPRSEGKAVRVVDRRAHQGQSVT
ncbi:MAG: phenylacetate--CoA ligase [Chloroflexi bacterium]|nr:phenylacetate--CoA ligase [Chloroflexota bacterium]